MTLNADLMRIANLLLQVPKAPDQPLPAGLTDQELDDFTRTVGVSIPPEQADLLRLWNGPCVGPGGVFGVRTALDSLDLIQLYDSHPDWREKRWAPIAGDGCGNYYVAIARNEGWPVVFIDTMEDSGSPAYIVASGVFRFMIALLERELEDTGWPFNEARVTASDPSITNYAETFPLPWRA